MRQKGQKFSFTIGKKREGRRWSLNLWVFPSTCQEEFGQQVMDEPSIKVGHFAFCPGSQRAQFKLRPNRWESIHWCQRVLDWEDGGCRAIGLNSLPFSTLTALSLGSPVIVQKFSRAEPFNILHQVLRFLCLVPLQVGSVPLHVGSLMCSWGKQCSSSYSLLPAYLTTHTVNISSKALSSHDNTALSTESL